MKFKTMKSSNQFKDPEWKDYDQWKKNNKNGWWEDFKEEWYKTIHPEKEFNTLEDLEKWALEQDYGDWKEGVIVIDFPEKEIIVYDFYMD